MFPFTVQTETLRVLTAQKELVLDVEITTVVRSLALNQDVDHLVAQTTAERYHVQNLQEDLQAAVQQEQLLVHLVEDQKQAHVQTEAITSQEMQMDNV